MKSKTLFCTFLVAMLVLTGQTTMPLMAAISNSHASTHQIATEVHVKKGQRFKTKASHFFKRAKQFWKEKTAKISALLEGEKASTLARTALYLFLGSLGLSILASAAAFASAAISAIVALAFLASIVLSFIVLFGDENRKSRAIAKAILITTGILIFLTLAIYALVIVILLGL
ncbi:MAG: hypothetical protein IT258_00520 [Saprospiraceae bacterium]|nr:hypothetical protein [Saprospiraceae bacterium]